MKTYCKQTSKLLKSNLQIQCNPYQIINGIFHRIRTKISTLCRRRWWHPTPVLLSGKSHGRRSLVGCSSWGHEESDTTEWLHFHFSLSCDGEGNGNLLQCSCLENPRDRGAWWAAVHGVAQSRTQLKQLGGSGSSIELGSVGNFLRISPGGLRPWILISREGGGVRNEREGEGDRWRRLSITLVFLLLRPRADN